MVVNLDLWFDPNNWPKNQPKEESGVAVIDTCLIAAMSSDGNPKERNFSNQSLGKNNKSHTSPKTLEHKVRTPRKRNFPSKLQHYVLANKPTGFCPKCTLYVRDTDDGVACDTCQAFWHYVCVGVTQQELDEEWNERPFLCPKHRELCVVDAPTKSEESKEVKVLIKVNSYTLNPQKL